MATRFRRIGDLFDESSGFREEMNKSQSGNKGDAAGNNAYRGKHNTRPAVAGRVLRKDRPNLLPSATQHMRAQTRRRQRKQRVGRGPGDDVIGDVEIAAFLTHAIGVAGIGEVAAPVPAL